MISRWWFVIPVIFLAFFIGMVNLYDGIVSQAEVNSLRHIGLHQTETNTIPEILESIVRLSPQHAPLYFITLKFWYETFGRDPGIIRLMSILWATLTVAMIYRLGVTLGHGQAGLYASMFAVSSWAFMYYSHEIRQYAFLLFVSSTVIWIYWQVINRKRTVPLSYWFGLFLTSALSIYIHYFGILTLIGIGIYHIVFVKKDRRWVTVTGVELLAGLTFLPWLSIMVRGAQTMPDLSERSLAPLDVLYQILFFHSNGLWFILLGLLLIVLLRFRHLLDAQKFAVVVLMSMIASIFVIHQLRPILFEGRLRYIIVFLPMIAVVAGIGFSLLGRFQQGAFVILLVLFGAGVIFTQSDVLYDYAGLDRTPPYDDILAKIDVLGGMNESLVSLSTDDDKTVVSFQVRDYYSKLTGRRILHINDTNASERQAENLEKTIKNDIGFWLAYWSEQVPLDQMTIYSDLILQDFYQCRQYINEDKLKLYFMARYDVPCDIVELDEPLVQYDTGVALSNVWSSVIDDTLHIYVWWQGIPFETYGVSLQIFDENGERVAQDDFVIVEGLHHRELAWDRMPSGDYDLQMILYNLENTSSIEGHLWNGTQFDRSFLAETISVE